MYKQIMVAVDDSDVSLEALKEAIKLAKEHNAKLRLLHIIDEAYVDYVGLGIDYDRLEESYKASGRKILNKMETHARELKMDVDTQLVEIKASNGRTPEKIIEAAKKWPADLLVIGTHGRQGFHHFLLGSVAEGVIRIAPIPVLLIRGKVPQ